MRGCLRAVLSSFRFFFAFYPANPRNKTQHSSPIFAPTFLSGLPDFKYAPWVLMLPPMGGWEQDKTNIQRRLFGWYVRVAHRPLFVGFKSGVEKHKPNKLHYPKALSIDLSRRKLSKSGLRSTKCVQEVLLSTKTHPHGR